MSQTPAPRGWAPSREELEATFAQKHLVGRAPGPGPRRRQRVGYFTPDDVYEALLNRLIRPGTAWLDVGSGRDIFPSNRGLAAELSARAGVLVGVDPSGNILENPYLHERFQGTLEEYPANRQFDVVSSRMVAEHISEPERTVRRLAELTCGGAVVVLLTVNKHTPVAAVAAMTPLSVHHRVKRFFWRTEERDTFPVVYRMNTRADLRALFEAAGFRENYFAYLPDCRVLSQFGWIHYAELVTWRACEACGLTYPENCLLGVYQRLEATDGRK